MELSHSIRKRFVKDYELPITIVQDPFWDYYMDLYDKAFSTKTLLADLEQAINKCGGEKEFFEESDRISKTIIKDIGETEAFKKFNTPLKIDQKEQEEANKWLMENGNKDLYIAENSDKCFVAIDMTQANFNSLADYDPAIVLYSQTWGDLLEKYIEDYRIFYYFSKSKYFRQVVFGNLNPRRQRSLIRFINTTKILPKIKDQKVVSVSDDQCVFEIPETQRENLSHIEWEWREKISVPVKVTAFKLKRIGDKPYYVREEPAKETFKCCPAHYFNEIYKYYYGMELGILDGHTYHEGRIVKYTRPLFNDMKRSDIWERLSDKMLGITRQFNEEKSWQEWTTSGWRMMSDSSLRDLLQILDIHL